VDAKGTSIDSDADSWSAEESSVPEHAKSSLSLQILSVWAFFLPLKILYEFCGATPVEVFFSETICISALRHWPVALVVIGAVFAGSMWRRELSWASFDLNRPVRRFVLVLSLTLAFAFSTYSYNFFLGHWHFLDRILLVVLALATWRSPLFVAPFLLQATLMASQFKQPIVFSWTDKRPLYDLLILFQAALVLKLFRRRTGFLPYIGAAICMIAMYYVLSVYGKLQFGWLMRGSLADLFMGAVIQNGWMTPFGNDTIVQTRNIIDTINIPLKVITFAIQGLLLFCLFDRRLLLIALLGCAGMHVGIFASSGILFWKWIAMDVAMAGILWNLPRADAVRLFGTRMMLFGCLVICLVLPIYFRGPVKLAWYDSSMVSHFHFEAVGQSGRIYQVPPSHWAPYDLAFAQGRFYYLGRIPRVVNCFGSVYDDELLDAIEKADNVSAVDALHRDYGQNRHDPLRTEWFDKFVRRYFMMHNEGGRRQPTHWGAPQHIWSYPNPEYAQDVFTGQESIVLLRVRLKEFLTHDNPPRIVLDRTIREVRIPPSQ